MCLFPSSIRFPAAAIMCLHPNVLDWLSHCLRFVCPHLSYLPSRQVIFSPCASIPSFFYSFGSFSAWQGLPIANRPLCFLTSNPNIDALLFSMFPDLKSPLKIRRTFCWRSQDVDGLSPLCFYSILFILYKKSLVLHVYQILIILSQKIPSISCPQKLELEKTDMKILHILVVAYKNCRAVWLCTEVEHRKIPLACTYIDGDASLSHRSHACAASTHLRLVFTVSPSLRLPKVAPLIRASSTRGLNNFYLAGYMLHPTGRESHFVSP